MRAVSCTHCTQTFGPDRHATESFSVTVWSWANCLTSQNISFLKLLCKINEIIRMLNILHSIWRRVRVLDELFVTDLIIVFLHPTLMIFPLCIRPCARDSACSLTLWMSLFNKPCTHIFGKSKPPSPPCKCPRRRASCPLPPLYGVAQNPAGHSSLSSPPNLATSTFNLPPISLSVHLSHWVTVICLFSVSSCKFLEGGDLLFIWCVHLIIYSWL